MKHIRYYKANEINEIINTLENPVVVMGNGLNLESGIKKSSWQETIVSIACSMEKELDLKNENPLSGFVLRMLEQNNNDVSMPELYDWLLLRYEEFECQQHCRRCSDKLYSSKTKVKKFIDEVVKDELIIKSTKAYQTLYKWCTEHHAPVLTTNYENNLVSSELFREGSFEPIDIKREKTNAKDSPVFPVGKYIKMADSEVDKDLLKNAAVWNINGYMEKEFSPRLSLRDYMQYAKFIINNNLIHDKNNNTWVQLFRDGNLVFAGIGLDVDETILRWLLIERRRYYYSAKTKTELPKSYYIQFNKPDVEGMTIVKRSFLMDLGIEVLDLQDGEKLSDCFAVV